MIQRAWYDHDQEFGLPDEDKERKMGRIELKHFPASKLADELRGGIPINASVKVVVEEETIQSRPLTGNDLREMLSRARDGAPAVTIEEAVSRIRALRDEWDD